MAKYFEEIFKELVPEGSGRLVMRRRDPATVMVMLIINVDVLCIIRSFQASQSESASSSSKSSRVLSQRSIPETELLTGVAIQVSFALLLYVVVAWSGKLTATKTQYHTSNYQYCQFYVFCRLHLVRLRPCVTCSNLVVDKSHL